MLSIPSTISNAVSVSSAISASMPVCDYTPSGYPLGVRWQILGESERPRSGAFVAVAVARDDITATLVRDTCACTESRRTTRQQPMCGA